LCEGVAFGQTFRGLVSQAVVRDIVPPGQYRYATVFVTNPYTDRFVNGWSNARCMFLR